MAKKSILQVIQENNWRASNILDATDVNALIQSGIIKGADPSSQAIIDALDLSNVQSEITIGIAGSDYAEPNFGDASDARPNALKGYFDEYKVKTFYQNQWWSVSTIQRDLLNTTQPVRLVLNRIGAYWAKTYNMIIASTLSGMSDIDDITEGDGNGNLSRDLIIKTRANKGDYGWSKLATMYLNSTTMADIQTKQEAGTIKEKLITAKYGTVVLVSDGQQRTVSSEVPEWVYDGVTPIKVDDAMRDGVISLVDEGAFTFTQKQITSPVMYTFDALSGNGSGEEKWGTKSLYILHPNGFDFVGKKGTDYQSKSGVTFAELQGGGLYALKIDRKLSKISNLRVKIG